MGRGTQVVRERSAKPLHVSSILTRASNFSEPRLTRDPSLRSGFRLRAPASLTPANRLKFDSDARLQRFPCRWRSSEKLVLNQSGDSNKSRAKHAQSTWLRSNESCSSPSDVANTLTKLMTGRE